MKTRQEAAVLKPQQNRNIKRRIAAYLLTNQLYLADLKKYNSFDIDIDNMSKLLDGFGLTERSGSDLFRLTVVGPIPHLLELMVMPRLSLVRVKYKIKIT